MITVRTMPYTMAARVYNHSVGIRFFRSQRRAFEHIVRQCDVRFRSAVDLGCGTGLFACYLARCWGARVFGIDRSMPMLRVACRNCRDTRVRFFRQDIRDFRIPRHVDLATCNFDTVNHLIGRGDVPRLFCRTAEALQPGGHFFFDVVTPVFPSRHGLKFQRAFHFPEGDIFQTIRWQPSTRLIAVKVLQIPSCDTPATLEVHRERSFTPEELSRWLHDAGFVIRGVFDSSSLEMPLDCPIRIIVLARKRA